MAEKYRQMVLGGLPVTGLDVIDAHDHLGPYFNFPIHRGGGIESMLERADTAGIRAVCIAANAAISSDMLWGNDETADAVRRFPGRAYGYVTIKPCPEEEMAAELEKRFALSGFIGVKLHPGLHGVGVTDDSYRPAMEYADAHGLPVLIHTWSHADVSGMEELSRRYPKASLIIAHMGGAPDVLDHALEVMKKRDNVYGDTALSYAPHGSIEYAVKKASAAKVIFGTDMPFYDPVFTLARVVCAELRDCDIEKIVGGNFRTICPGMTI